MHVVQMAYTAWPDHGVPATTKEMLDFRRAVRIVCNSFGTASPLLAHCSAGVGRTGTFLGLDRFFEAVVRCENVSVRTIVEDMRESRNMMVQSQIQYVYLYLACLDGMERLLVLLDKVRCCTTGSPLQKQRN